jgi:hypothetical protein
MLLRYHFPRLSNSFHLKSISLRLCFVYGILANGAISIALLKSYHGNLCEWISMLPFVEIQYG